MQRRLEPGSFDYATSAAVLDGREAADAWRRGKVRPEGKGKTDYPTQRTRGTLGGIVRQLSRPGDLVMDVFTDGGRFGEAAVVHGRDGMLIDDNPEAVRVMERRFTAARCVGTGSRRRSRHPQRPEPLMPSLFFPTPDPKEPQRRGRCEAAAPEMAKGGEGRESKVESQRISDSRESSAFDSRPSTFDLRPSAAPALAEEVLRICRLMYEQGLIVATDGNVSARLDADRFLITPSGRPKGMMAPEDLILCDMEGHSLDANRKPSSEVAMHVACYAARPDIGAVVHAHPPHAVAFTIAGKPLDTCVIPEVVLNFGGIPTVPYTTPTTYEVPEAVSGAIKDCDALMLETHGSVTVGPTVMSAYLKLESLEHSAKILFLAHCLGAVHELPPHEAQKLFDLRRSLNLGGKAASCTTRGRRLEP